MCRSRRARVFVSSRRPLKALVLLARDLGAAVGVVLGMLGALDGLDSSSGAPLMGSTSCIFFYEYYLWKKMQEVEPIKGAPELESKPSKAPSIPKTTPTAAPRSRASNTSAFKERRELTQTLARLERHIAKLEGEIAAGDEKIQARDQELASQELYQDHERWTVLMKEREGWVKDQSVLTAQWAELCEQAERLRAKLKELEGSNR